MPQVATSIIDLATLLYNNFFSMTVVSGYPTLYKVGDTVYIKGLNHKDDIITETRIKDVIISYKHYLEPYYILENFPNTIVRECQLSKIITKDEVRKMMKYKRRKFFRKLFKRED